MEKRIVQSLMVASVVMFALAILLAAFARPMANAFITITGRGSAGLAVLAVVMLVVFKIAERRSVR